MHPNIVADSECFEVEGSGEGTSFLPSLRSQRNSKRRTSRPSQTSSTIGGNKALNRGRLACFHTVVTFLSTKYNGRRKPEPLKGTSGSKRLLAREGSVSFRLWRRSCTLLLFNQPASGEDSRKGRKGIRGIQPRQLIAIRAWFHRAIASCEGQLIASIPYLVSGSGVENTVWKSKKAARDSQTLLKLCLRLHQLASPNDFRLFSVKDLVVHAVTADFHASALQSAYLCP